MVRLFPSETISLPPESLLTYLPLILCRCVTAWTFSNVIAGSDSTAVVMKTIWYNLLAHPKTMQRLLEELRQAEAKHPMAKPYPAWRDVCDLPYLDACIQEGVRMHPPFCLPLERVVPAGGITIGGKFLPEATVVGMSPYVVNRHKPTFGQDAEDWNPDRWMVPKELRQKREAAIMTVGIHSIPMSPPHLPTSFWLGILVDNEQRDPSDTSDIVRCREASVSWTAYCDARIEKDRPSFASTLRGMQIQWPSKLIHLT